MPKKTLVAVIGAGLSGLAAAYELSKNKKIAVTIFESRGQVGGRVKSVAVDGHSVDLGGFIVYPWYVEYHRLINELNLTKKLKKITDVAIYYQLDAGGKFFSEADLPVSIPEKIAFGTRLLPAWIRSRPNFFSPDLGSFSDTSIAEFLSVEKIKSTALFKFIDCVNQAYCYAPATDFRMSFYAPFVYQTLVHGDLTTGYYFGGNNQLFTDCLAQAIIANGGDIRCNSPVTNVDNRKITACGVTKKYDAVIFASTVDNLYAKIITAPAFSYTHFYTVVMRLDQSITIDGSSNWTAVFTAPVYPETNQITSVIRAQNMAPELRPEYVIINYKTVTDEPLSESDLSLEIGRALQKLFPEIKTSKLVTTTRWGKTMPIATAQFVAEIRAKQGVNGYYFAGDYLGAPSMETALKSGVVVAGLVGQPF